MSTFVITLRDYPGVLLSGWTRIAQNLAAGSPCTLSDVYASNVGGVAQLSFQLAAGYAEVVTSDHGTFDIADAPSGFMPTTNLRAVFARAFELQTGDSLTLEDVGVASAVHNGPYAETSVSTQNVALPDSRSLTLLRTDIFRVTKTGPGIGASYAFLPYIPNTQTIDEGVCGGPPLQFPAFQLSGDYVIAIVWWKIPDRDACGNPQSPHLKVSETDPGPPWERFDPDDLEAAPVPTIATIEPDHGLTVGGDLVTIRGSGFGDACVLTVDGLEVDRTVVDANTITYLAPAHAAGPVDVVVTNEDGTATP